MALATVDSQRDLFASHVPKSTWAPRKWTCVPRTQPKLDQWTIAESLLSPPPVGSELPEHLYLFGERFYFDMLHDGDIDAIFLKVHQVLASTGRHLSIFVNDTAPHALSNEVFATFQMLAASIPTDSDVWARVEENTIRILRRLPTFREITDKNALHAMLTIWMCAVELVSSSGGGSRNILEQVSIRFMQELTTLEDETATGARLGCRCQEHAWIQLVRINSSRYWARLNRALSNESDDGGVFSGCVSIKIPVSLAVTYAVEIYADYPAVFERGKRCMLPGSVDCWKDLLAIIAAFLTQLDDRPLLQVCAKLLGLLHHRKNELCTIDGTESLLLKLWEHIAPKLSDRKELGNDLTLPASVSDYAQRLETYARLDSISTEHDSLWTVFSKLSLFCCQEANVWELLQRQLFEQWTSLKAKRWNHTETERVLAFHLVHALSTDLAFIAGRVLIVFKPVLEADSCSDPRIHESILNSFIFLLELSWQRNQQPADLEQCVRKGNFELLLKCASDAKFPSTRADVGIIVWVFKSLAPRNSPPNVELVRRLESCVPRIKDEYLGAIFEQLEAAASIPQTLWKRAVTLWATQRTTWSGSALKLLVKQLSVTSGSRPQKKAKLDAVLEEFSSNFKQSKAVQPLVELVNHCSHVGANSDVMAPLWLMVLFLSADDQLAPDVAETVHKLLLALFQDMDPFIEECNGGLAHDNIFFWALESLTCIESGMDPTATQQAREVIKDWFFRRLAEIAQTQLARDDVPLSKKTTILRRCSLVLQKIGSTLFAVADTLNGSTAAALLQCLSDAKSYPNFSWDVMDVSDAEEIVCNTIDGLLSVDAKRCQRPQDLKFYLARRVNALADVLLRRGVTNKLVPVLRKHSNAELLRDPSLERLREILDSV